MRVCSVRTIIALCRPRRHLGLVLLHEYLRMNIVLLIWLAVRSSAFATLGSMLPI